MLAHVWSGTKCNSTLKPSKNILGPVGIIFMLMDFSPNCPHCVSKFLTSRIFIFQIQLYNSLPLNSLSQWAGDLSKREIPRWARRLIFGTYCRIYQVNLDEAIESDLTQYPTLNEFFRRKLKPECRPIDQNADLVVPCDGKVLHCGVITDENQVEQVKGMTYTLNEFLGGSYNNLQIKDEVNLFFNILLFRTGCLTLKWWKLNGSE